MVTLVVIVSLAVVTSTPALTTANVICDVINNATDDVHPAGYIVQEVEKYEAMLLLFLGFGGVSVLLAVAYNAIHRYVFRDVNNLDSSFDAGGRVTTSLTAVTVGVQLLWPADMLQSATVTAKYGIAGAFWYSASVVVNIILFPLLSMQFKSRAPGAKTFLQVVRARFGSATHIVFCCLALVTNLVILTAIIVSCASLFKALIVDASDELCVVVMALLFGCYSFIGGLGSTFYVSYFNAVVIFSLLAAIVTGMFYVSASALPVGDVGWVYDRLSCLTGPPGNLQSSYLTFWSTDSLVWMVQGTLIAASVTFCDQASWQSRIAARPLQGVLGFLGGAFLWFAVPSTIGITTALTYLALTAGNSSLALSVDDINAGLVTPYVLQLSYGHAGALMVLAILSMLMMSTGSGEVMGISSIIVYDICMPYFCPFRVQPEKDHCLLCGKMLPPDTDDVKDVEDLRPTDHEQICQCPSANDCSQCEKDKDAIFHTSGFASGLLRHQCTVHGEYRTYQDAMLRLKSWVILFVSLGIIPLGLVALESGVDLNWIFMTGCIITIPCFPGVVLSLVWVKTTAKGAAIGSVVGLLCGVSVTIFRASLMPGGLSDFVLNTSEGYTVLAGSCTSFFLTLILTVLISLLTHTIKDEKDAEAEWQKLRDIDNPLSPWGDAYRVEGKEGEEGWKGRRRPDYPHLQAALRSARVAAFAGSGVCLVILLLVIPGLMLSLHVLTAPEFSIYVTSTHCWCFFMAAVVILVAPIEEIRNILQELRRRSTPTHTKLKYDGVMMSEKIVA